jgi:hypothetical protein
VYEQDIARGVAVLNRQLPEWRATVDLELLDLGRVSRCVVGQALGVVDVIRTTPTEVSWYDALERLGAPGISSRWGTAETIEWVENHGFEARRRREDGLRDYDRLTFEWASYLTGNLELPDLDQTTSPEDTK